MSVFHYSWMTRVSRESVAPLLPLPLNYVEIKLKPMRLKGLCISSWPFYIAVVLMRISWESGLCVWYRLQLESRLSFHRNRPGMTWHNTLFLFPNPQVTMEALCTGISWTRAASLVSSTHSIFCWRGPSQSAKVEQTPKYNKNLFTAP